MTKTLVTILGKAQRPDGAGYNEATYRFPNGDTDQTAFFGLALARYLNPDKIVILGTAGSFWSVLTEALAGESGDREDARIALMEASDAEEVEQPLLDRVAPLMAEAMNAEARPTLIPDARDEAAQYAILEAVDNAVAASSELHFDLTHGYRHLGMVGFLSSFMLERLRDMRVRGLWYGALDMTADGITPVLRLDGLVRVRRWLDALDRFDATGDYGLFAPLLKEDGVPNDKANCLEAAAFLERTVNVRDAARKIATFLPVLEQPLPGPSGLFQRDLAECLSWAKAPTVSQQQCKLAHRYLDRGDFVRAAVFGRESCVTRLFEENDVTFDERYSEDRTETLKDLASKLPDSRRRGYQALTAMRNALAHGTRPEWRAIEIALRDPRRLKRELQTALQGFFE